ncbi:MAG TPA: hypothetical protein VND66_02495 [Acidobacteriaceae bacterium]|nr:hypothetical protein [Terriglobia bacterium]HVC89470.1 hypothetical protein [Acidobacteriaceae bacterium]
MSNGILSKIGHALSIFGVSNPDDIRKMERRKMPPTPATSPPPESPLADSSHHPEESAPNGAEKEKPPVR